MISTFYIRILITLGFFIGTANLLTYAFPIKAQNAVGSFDTLSNLNKFGSLIYMVAFISILIRIWKNQLLDKRAKGQWTILVILLPIILGTYYLWGKERQIEKVLVKN